MRVGAVDNLRSGSVGQVHLKVMQKPGAMWILLGAFVLGFSTWIGPVLGEPCEKVDDLCKEGKLYGDPSDCSLYYKCDDTGALVAYTCDEGKLFDYKQETCLAGEVQCAPPCEKKENTVLEVTKPDVESNSSILGVTSAPMGSTDQAMNNSSVAHSNSSEAVNIPGNKVTASAEDSPTNSSLLPQEASSEGESTDIVPAGVPLDLVTKVEEEVVISTQSSEETTVTTTSTPLLTTTTPSSTAKTTTAKLSSNETEVIVPDKPSEAIPPYLVFTKSSEASTVPSPEKTTNGSLDGAADHLKTGGLSPVMIFVIAGVAAALIVLIVIIVIIACIIKKKRRKKRYPSLHENPIYRNKDVNTGQNYRFSRDSNLFLEMRVNNNKNDKYNNNAKKKRKAPAAPVQKKTANKRRAPAPPNPFTGECEDQEELNLNRTGDSDDLYEKDTNAGSEENLEMTTFVAPPNTPDRMSQEENKDEEADPQDPLLNMPEQLGEEETAPSSSSPGTAAQPRSTEYSSTSSSSSDESSSADEGQDAKQEVEDPEEEGSKGLLEEHEEEDPDLDNTGDYDKDKNPFMRLANSEG